MRLIDAEKLREEWLHSSEFDNETINTILGSIDEAPTIEPEDGRDGGWVPASLFLPDDECDGMEFICMTTATGRTSGVIAMSFEVTTIRGETVRRWKWHGKNSLWTVTHWMPLPNPPGVTDDG